MELLEAQILIDLIIAKENQLEHAAKEASRDCERMDYKIDPHCYGYPDECKTCEVPIYYNFKII